MTPHSEMQIAGIEKCSLVDYPGCLAAVFFTRGCNWKCFYCHNRSLCENGAAHGVPWLSTEVALAWLEDRRGFLDGVVVSGGEPTLQPGLAAFLRKVRGKGYRVKLDTNGSHPEVLEGLLDEGLLDYVAMDLKAPFDKHQAIVRTFVDPHVIDRSVDLLLAGRVDYEFRTTVVPQLTESDVLEMSRRIRGARRYVLQQYRRPVSGLSDPRLDLPPHPARWPWRIYDEIETLVEHCETRGFERAVHAAEMSAA